MTALPPPTTPHQGLSTSEASARLARDGANTLVPSKEPEPWREILAALADPMGILLLVAAATYWVLGDHFDAAVTTAAIVPTTGAGLLLERRAHKALAALRALQAPTARAWRDGAVATIRTEEVVVGDWLEVKEGDIIPADGRTVDPGGVTVDESVLTGEALPITKSEDDAALWAGTTVLAGRALLEVEVTGQRTRYGRIAQLVAKGREPRTPLQRAVRRLVIQLGIAAVVACLAVVLIAKMRGEGWADALIAGISLAIAAVPEEFPLVFTLYLGLGAWRLARQKALVRRLVGVETLGSATVICTDKTGTLTQGALSLAVVAHAEAGQVEKTQAGSRWPTGARQVLSAAMRASEAEPFDPLERAILEAVAKGERAPEDAELLQAHPFDPVSRTMARTWRVRGTERIFAKGAFEGIATLSCNPSAQAAFRVTHDALAASGMRVLAVAQGPLERVEMVGLIAFSDPLRPGVGQSIADCTGAGIRVIMVTGDHAATAQAIGRQAGLPLSTVLTGAEMERLDPAARARAAATSTIFARVLPEQKLQLVEELRNQGEVVAMTGDGINDAPALRAADIGIAMGLRGTEVARQAATLVLLDDDFSTIVRAIRQGRRLMDNLQHAFAYILGFHPPLLVAAILVPLAGQPLLLLPVHLVVLELILHPTSSLVFDAEPEQPDLMRRPPRKAGKALLSAPLVLAALIPGMALALVIVGTYLTALRIGSVEHARALAFATMLVGQGFLVVVARGGDLPFWAIRTRNRTLLPVLLLTLVLSVVAIQWEPVSVFLHLAPLGVKDWGIAVGLATCSVLILEPWKAFRTRNRSGLRRIGF